MSIFDRAKTLAEIAELASRVYGLIIDKSRSVYERDAKIKDLERQIAELRARVGQP